MKTKNEIERIYAAVSSKEGMLYHVAHARKENSDKEYDGAALKAIAKGRRKQDVQKLKDVSEVFRERSMARDD